MKYYKPDSICKRCYNSNAFDHHICYKTAGKTWRGPYSARRYLSKDGLSCKFFTEKVKNIEI